MSNQRSNKPALTITPQQSATLYDKYGKRLSHIESNLNIICSQHDALMPLLQLLDTMPQLAKADQILRTAAKKTTELEHKIDKLHKVYSETKNKQLLIGVQGSFAQVSKNLAECKEGVRVLEKNYQQFTNKNKDQCLVNNENLNREIENKCETSRKQIQSLLAEFKNEIEIKYKKSIRSSKSSTASITSPSKPIQYNYSNLFPTSPFMELQQQLRNLYTEISMIQLELPQNNVMQFHNYNFSRINYELYEIQEMIDKIYNDQPNQKSSQYIQAFDELLQFQQRVEWLGYQVKGLRKKYLIELNNIAERGDSIQQLQQKLSEDLQSLHSKQENLFRKIFALKQYYEPLIEEIPRTTRQY